jgi:hypothetical protein
MAMAARPINTIRKSKGRSKTTVRPGRNSRARTSRRKTKIQQPNIPGSNLASRFYFLVSAQRKIHRQQTFSKAHAQHFIFILCRLRTQINNFANQKE